MAGAVSPETAALALNSHLGNAMNGNNHFLKKANRYSSNINTPGPQPNGSDSDSVHGKFLF